jgi:AcrR family transcriptional regulator
MNSKQQASEQTRAQLITAAFSTLREHGANKLTLDAVAKLAEVSKGGLLHHFPNKEALLDALLRQLLDDYRKTVEDFYEREPDSRGRWLRAYIRATFSTEDLLPIELLAMLFAAISEYPNLLRLVQDDFQDWQKRLASDGVAQARVRLIRMAADSYWQERLFGMGESAEERQDLMNELLAWVEDRK